MNVLRMEINGNKFNFVFSFPESWISSILPNSLSKTIKDISPLVSLVALNLSQLIDLNSMGLLYKPILKCNFFLFNNRLLDTNMI